MVDLSNILSDSDISSQEYNVYCDESCHLLNNDSQYMVLGAVWCPKKDARKIAEEIRYIKKKHWLKTNVNPFEIKWTKVSKSKIEFYEELIEYFFVNPKLHFRAVVADKSNLNHSAYGNTHDDWYYRMYWVMLKAIFDNAFKYYIYLDIKDTNSGQKPAKLQEVLKNTRQYFNGRNIKRMQIIRSHEAEQMQLADLLIGAVKYANNNILANEGKIKLVEKIREYCGQCLTETNTLMCETKFNILHWSGQETDS